MIEIRSVEDPASIVAAQSLVRAHIIAASTINGAELTERVVAVIVEHAIAVATARGYSRLRLGTLPDMHAAQRLYTSLGFQRIPPYRSVELGETWFYERPLGE